MESSVVAQLLQPYDNKVRGWVVTGLMLMVGGIDDDL
jgi:hypothetical protein